MRHEAALAHLAKSPHNFWRRVMPVTESGCWIWTGCSTKQGYGSFGWKDENGKGVLALAHRISWALSRGPIPDGLVIDHLCKVTCCVNPDHLEPVTQKENYWRSNAREGTIAFNASITTCPQGHEYTPDNTLIRINRGYKCRRCKTCENIRIKIRNSKRDHRKLGAIRRAKAKARLAERRAA